MDCGIDESIIKTNDSIIIKIQTGFSSQKWWNEYLGKIKEPSLKEEKTESYRLLIYDAMWASLKMYRIFEDTDSYKIAFKEFGGEQIEPEYSMLTSDYEKELSEKKWNEFKELTEKLNFWSMKVNDEKTGLDGTSWILEGKMPNANNCTNRDYHLVGRWEPADSLVVMELNKKLISFYCK
ncbi:hypothetical protein MNBD_BACTEROID03-2132 [hydrothermal vent metagenome]|uniref:Uncharacterized protein n=1 Tax=hydrothermal vent metagenome TaxID=652676 RepID=A0A3B0U678_9ZZZZ